MSTNPNHHNTLSDLIDTINNTRMEGEPEEKFNWRNQHEQQMHPHHLEMMKKREEEHNQMIKEREDEIKNMIKKEEEKKRLSQEEIDKLRKSVTVRGLSGLDNMGNTCYMNAVVQCLSATKYFSAYVNKKKFKYDLKHNVMHEIAKKKRKDLNLDQDTCINISKNDLINKTKYTVTYQLHELLIKMWEENQIIRPAAFKHIIGNIDPKNSTFRGNSQNDSQELLSFILDKIHEETKREVELDYHKIPPNIILMLKMINQAKEVIENKEITLEEKEMVKLELKSYQKKNYADHVMAKSVLYWKDYVKKSHSVITDIFTGIFYSNIECNTCKEQSPTFEPFTLLSVPIPEKGETTLESCLERFSGTEMLTGDEKYKCDSCKQISDANKKIYIWNPPEILCIQLKRFNNTGYRIMKNHSKVTFPLKDLELNQNYSEYHKCDFKYDLYGVIEHRGVFGGGHYVAYCKNAMNGKWYEYNDDDVYHIPDSNLEKEVITQNSYILFYQRQHKNT
ncbi:MAG: ubiquitin carboxyl-terminal hydrolase [Edafosvirus sp.]|uniref:Ubiquitin carboxyl-terminal hydrolase n=1 Tax=Edafosvirus sp. TaxID=2487765 RepID=A0A3G4ZWR8_9VIRU|nr:MAG: ubiquitin carboxyl-terminal hydrolase [Edafosvirus sp.]